MKRHGQGTHPELRMLFLWWPKEKEKQRRNGREGGRKERRERETRGGAGRQEDGLVSRD